MATLDIGSNTSLLLIAEVSSKNLNESHILEDKLFFTRLAEGFSSEKILPGPKITNQALKRQEVFFQKAKELIHQYSVEKIKCVATAASRKAINVQELLSQGEKYGFPIKIISAKEEAKLSHKGALFHLPFTEEETVVIDIGGASTEISTAHQVFSLPIGSVNLTERFLRKDPPDKKEISCLMKAIGQEVHSVPCFFSKNLTLVATAGTPTTLAALSQETDQWNTLHGERLNIQQVKEWWEHLFQLSFEKRKNLKGMPIYRADVLPAGLSILKQLMGYFQWEECVISITGLRYGLLCQF